jgi:hypothetical protein
MERHLDSQYLGQVRYPISLASSCLLIASEWNDTAPLADMIANQQKMTNVWVPQLKKIEPNSGAYLNEVRTYYYPTAFDGVLILGGTG